MRDRIQSLVLLALAYFALLASGFAGQAEDFALMCADRAAVERIYYNHRTGTKPPFEQTLSTNTLAKLVQLELRKEAALKKNYGVEITPAMIAAEVERINTTTRAPETLTEIKAALGHDPARFACSFAQPIVVDRLLRNRFENDDALHAPQRREVEEVRNELLAAKTNRADVLKLLALMRLSHTNAVTETTWQLSAHPAETNAPAVDELEIKKRFGANAQILSSPHASGLDQNFYFADLPVELQNVLRVQLLQTGDVSAVIEMPGGFLLYLAEAKTEAVLRVAVLSIPKRSYEQWLEEQN